MIPTIPKTAASQAEHCADNGYVISRSNLQPGDLVFWSLKNKDGSWKQPDRYRHISHVGIYAGDGKVIDASYARGKVVLRSIFATGSITMCGRIPGIETNELGEGI